MKITHRLFGFLYSISVILILLVTAFDVACYSDYGYFQKEYEKYEILDDLPMEMDDVMDVTRHMMEYLRGREESMQISATVDGQTRDFFNEQDLFHMAEVKVLFLGMFRLRLAALLVLAVSLAVLFATKARGRTLFLCFQAGLGIFLGIAAFLGIVIAVNFSNAFVIFHHLFFDNDLWLFDPATDLMINMLPEGLFMDFAVRILTIFVLLLIAFEAFLLILSRLRRIKAAKTLAAGLAFLLCCQPFCGVSFAAVSAAEDDLTTLPGWPAGPEIQADAAILIDARTGNILYAKDSNTAYPPASITKILTALIACEQSAFSDTIVYSHNAVYSVPYDGTTVGFSEDEAVSMKDSLYGMMLKSGNEAALGIAEHISGSVEAFSEVMNERARQAGATNSNFVNPNGLHDNNHYTTCHDMAMIMRDAVHNDSFLEIASAVRHEIAPTNINSEGYSFSTGHRMLNKNRTEYYEYAVAGKTGYTSKAGNTLVTYAKNGNMELICVILHSIQTHYSDTRTLCDYGFSNFTCYNAATEDNTYHTEGNGFFSFLSSAFEPMPVSVKLDDCYVILPSAIPFSALDSHLDYLEENADGEDMDILGYVTYEYQGIPVGRTALRLVTEELTTSLPGLPSQTPTENTAPSVSDSLSESDGASVYPADSSQSAGDNTETRPASDAGSKRIVINVWHLLGWIFLAVAGALVLGVLIHHYSPKQRRARKARQMRRIYMSDERKKKKKRRELR